MQPADKKVWLVTGASSGLGRAVVIYLLQQGEKVIATLRKPDDISDLALGYDKDQLLVVKLNVVSLPDIQAAFAEAIDKFGRVDVVYNNAGIGSLGEVEGTPDEVARNLFEVNFWGSTNVAREAVRVFRDINKPSGGRLLQASSMVGFCPQAALGYYSASKHALEAVSQAMAAELLPSWNIKVTILEIGGFVTQGIHSMVVAPAHPAYDAPGSVSKAIRGFLNPATLTGGGDANKAAREICKIASDDSVELRVPLGLDAIAAIKGQLAKVQLDVEEAGKWSTDLKFDA